MRFRALYDGAYDAALLTEWMDACGISALTARALYRRGLRTRAEAETFLHPSRAQLFDPYLLPDMDVAVARIRAAVAANERICIYGDYDADGVCAGAILLKCFRKLRANAFLYIPSRHGDGYGLNAETIRKLAASGVRLIVTVDNGIAAIEEAELCAALGVQLIVTDHHRQGDRLPKAVAVVSASRTDAAYPNPHLCGAAVAMKLSCALLPDEDHADDLALAAVATVADVVPLLGENRAIVACGMPHIVQNAGLAELIDVAGAGEKPVSSKTLAYLIAPRLNAAGRMADAQRAAALLLCTERRQANPLAVSLNNDNRLRQDIEAEIMQQALDRIAEAHMEEQSALLLHRADWNPGVVGIVASRLAMRFGKPAILFTGADGVLTGSGRSPAGIDLYGALQHFSDRFVRFGGHRRAAGVTIEEPLLAALQSDFSDYIDSVYPPDMLQPTVVYEEQVALGDLTQRCVEELELLGPFGEGNPEPVVLLDGVRFCDVSYMSGGAHLSASLTDGETAMRTVAFGKGDRHAELTEAGSWQVTAKPVVNRFRGRETVELMLMDAVKIQAESF